MEFGEQTFRDLGLSEAITSNLDSLGFHKPTEIQEKVIPHLLENNNDILGLAQTGTGKTASFALPLIDSLETEGNHRRNPVQALVLAPTRELAKQIKEEFLRLKAGKKIRITPVYGGQPIGTQIRELQSGSDIVVGTPGRVIDLIDRGVLQLNDLKYVVLDEADEMLNMGFVDDIESILSQTPEERRMLLFSATMPGRLKPVVSRYMKDKIEVNALKKSLTTNQTKELFYMVHGRDKFEMVKRVIDSHKDFYGIIFCKTKAESDELYFKLLNYKYAAEAIHGDIPQDTREAAIKRLKTGVSKILVATDVASRGVDIPNLLQVINYSLPSNPESYVHRVGRTGRAGKTGIAISLVTPNDIGSLRSIQSYSKGKIEQGVLPTIKEVVETQKDKVLTELGKSIESIGELDPDTTSLSGCLDLSKQILEEVPAHLVVAALIHNNFGTRLSEENYRELKIPKIYNNRDGGRNGNFRGYRGNGRGGSSRFRRSQGQSPTIERRGGGARGGNGNSRHHGNSEGRRKFYK